MIFLNNKNINLLSDSETAVIILTFTDIRTKTNNRSRIKEESMQKFRGKILNIDAKKIVFLA